MLEDEHRRANKKRRAVMAAITFYANPVDLEKLRKLAESRGISTAKLCRDIIAAWVRAKLNSEAEEEDYE